MKNTYFNNVLFAISHLDFHKLHQQPNLRVADRTTTFWPKSARWNANMLCLIKLYGKQKIGILLFYQLILHSRISCSNHPKDYLVKLTG
jgi:hypothetical protein